MIHGSLCANTPSPSHAALNFDILRATAITWKARENHNQKYFFNTSKWKDKMLTPKLYHSQHLAHEEEEEKKKEEVNRKTIKKSKFETVGKPYKTSEHSTKTG